MRSLLLGLQRGSSSAVTNSIGTPSFSGDITAKEITDLCHSLQSKFQQAIVAIEEESTTSTASWESTFQALSLALGETAEVSAVVTLPSMTHGNALARQASTNAKDSLKTMLDETFARPQLFQALKSLPVSKWENERLAFRMMANFQRNGCALLLPQREELLQKRKWIEETCSAFITCINENKDTLYFSDLELEGVTNLDQFPIDGNTNKRSVVLKAPFTAPILQFAKNPSTRKAAAVAVAQKCQSENTDRFLNTLQKRHEAAVLLGYESHAHYMLETKMAKSPERAQEFLLDLLEKLQEQRNKDLQILLKLKCNDKDYIYGGDDKTTLQPWDVNYYIQKYKATLGVDEAELQNYFPLDHVQNEILAIYEELLNLKFVQVQDAEIWHPDVECYAVLPAKEDTNTNNKNNNAPLGYFYFDIYPRPGKYSHQCVYPLRPSYTLRNGERVPPVCVNIGNLSRGSSSGSTKPSMLRFREVETFFHEFGHVMHCVLAQSSDSLQAWAWSAVPWPGGVEQDFLEVPSMMLENFVWQPETLKRLSKHGKNGTPLPDSMIEALCKSRSAMEGYSRCRYLAMALYDLKVHSSGPGPYEYKGNSYNDAIDLYNVMIKDIAGVPTIPGTFPVASWFHLMMGYDAGYYSYIWSEAFAADLFSEFEKRQGKTVIDPILGRKYRDTILSPCAMLDGDTMLQNFLGRPASNQAFLTRILE